MITKMYCENCGKKFEQGHKFCTKCGHQNLTSDVIQIETIKPSVVSNTKWWQRLLHVVYVFMCLQILWIVPLVWSTNNTDYSYYAGQYRTTYTYDVAFWYSILAIVIFIIITRVIKVTVLYVTLGQKPQWKKEFKKLY